MPSPTLNPQRSLPELWVNRGCFFDSGALEGLVGVSGCTAVYREDLCSFQAFVLFFFLLHSSTRPYSVVQASV